jgi:hypothetical protein
LPPRHHHQVPDCFRANATWTFGMICNGNRRVRNLQLEGVDPEELDWIPAVLTGENNKSALIGFRPKEKYGWHIPVVNKQNLTVRFRTTIDFQRLSIRYSEPYYIQADGKREWIKLVWPYKGYRWTFNVNYNGWVAVMVVVVVVMMVMMMMMTMMMV